MKLLGAILIYILIIIGCFCMWVWDKIRRRKE